MKAKYQPHYVSYQMGCSLWTRIRGILRDIFHHYVVRKPCNQSFLHDCRQTDLTWRRGQIQRRKFDYGHWERFRNEIRKVAAKGHCWPFNGITSERIPEAWATPQPPSPQPKLSINPPLSCGIPLSAKTVLNPCSLRLLRNGPVDGVRIKLL